MLDMAEVKRAIAELENGDTKFSVCAKLADLYAVRDHILGQPQIYDQAYSRAAAPAAPENLGLYGDSDFLQAVAGKDSSAAWTIMDELMNTLKVVNLRVYDSVMRKLGRL